MPRSSENNAALQPGSMVGLGLHAFYGTEGNVGWSIRTARAMRSGSCVRMCKPRLWPAGLKARTHADLFYGSE